MLTPARFMLARELSLLIDAAPSAPEGAKFTHKQLAAMIETSPASIAAILAGRAPITAGDLRLLYERLGYSDPHYLAQLSDLRREKRGRTYWRTGYRRAYDERFRFLVDVERYVSSIAGVELSVVPGILQTERYMRAVFSLRESSQDGLTVEDHVESRLARQEILSRVQLHYVLFESCVRRSWATDSVMREQIEHLLDLSHRSNILLQVLPEAVPASSTAYVLLRIPSRGRAGDARIAYEERPPGIEYVLDEESVAAYEQEWSRLVASALSAPDSRKHLRHIQSSFIRESGL